jgi:hypothetical protein
MVHCPMQAGVPGWHESRYAITWGLVTMFPMSLRECTPQTVGQRHLPGRLLLPLWYPPFVAIRHGLVLAMVVPAL